MLSAVAAIAFSSLCCDLYGSMYIGFLAPAANSSLSGREFHSPCCGEGSDLNLIPCILGVREYVVEFVEEGWEWVGHFYARRVEI